MKEHILEEGAYEDPEDIAAIVDSVLAYAEHRLEGPSRNTRLRALTYITDVAFKRGTLTVVCSGRPISIGAGLSLQTAISAVNDLVEAGCLRDAGKTKESAARLCRIPTHLPNAKPELRLDGSYLDVWHHHGFGSTGQRIHLVLTEQPASVATIAEKSDVSRWTVSRKLAHLELYGLSERSGSSWKIGPSDPAHVLLDRVTGARGRRKDRYDKEQKAHRAYLASLNQGESTTGQ